MSSDKEILEQARRVSKLARKPEQPQFFRGGTVNVPDGGENVLPANTYMNIMTPHEEAKRKREELEEAARQLAREKEAEKAKAAAGAAPDETISDVNKRLLSYGDDQVSLRRLIEKKLVGMGMDNANATKLTNKYGGGNEMFLTGYLAAIDDIAAGGVAVNNERFGRLEDKLDAVLHLQAKILESQTADTKKRPGPTPLVSPTKSDASASGPGSPTSSIRSLHPSKLACIVNWPINDKVKEALIGLSDEVIPLDVLKKVKDAKLPVDQIRVASSTLKWAADRGYIDFFAYHALRATI